MCKTLQFKKTKTKPQVRGSHHGLLSVVAELLWRSEVATVIADVGADAAALAPPLITVGGETRKSKIKTLEASHEHFFPVQQFPGNRLWHAYLAWMFWGIMLHARSSSLS